MSDHVNKKLYFIKSPSHNLKLVETFLSKREFDIYVESDLRESMTKLFEIEPDFIFLAWDHEDQNIVNLPKLIAQASNAIIVPYILSSKRTDSHKLSACQWSPKLYPPISGPTIERLILKTAKKNAQDEAHLVKMINSKTSTPEKIALNRENILTHLKSGTSENKSKYEVIENSDDQNREEKLIRHNSINVRNNILSQSKKIKLSNDTIVKLKGSLQSKVKAPLESLLNTLQESKDLTLQNSPIHTTKMIIQEGQGNSNNPGMIIQEGQGNSNNPGMIIQEGQGSSNNPGMIIQEGQGNSNKTALVIQSTNYKNAQNKAYCMTLYSDSWCGYLIITTQVELEFSMVDIIFTDWIKVQFDNLQEADEFDYFELKNIDFEIISELTENADYFEIIKVNNHDLTVSFFPIEPSEMALELNDDQSLIKILTEDIPSDVELNFSLYLHLPENKKYLLYNQANKTLTTDQKNRLITKKIHALFTPLEFEKEYKKFLTEKNVMTMSKNSTRKKSNV